MVHLVKIEFRLTPPFPNTLATPWFPILILGEYVHPEQETGLSSEGFGLPYM